MVEKIKKIFNIMGITLAVYLSMKYLLPIVAPFFAAYLLVRCIYPLATKAGEKLHLKKQTISMLILLLGTILIGAAIWVLVIKLCGQIRGVIEHLEYYEVEIERMLTSCCSMIERTFGIDAENVMDYLKGQVETAAGQIESYLLPNLLQHSMLCAMIIIKSLGVFFLIFIAVILLMRDYDEIKEKLENYRGYKKMMNIIDRLWSLGGEYLKAQGIIMLIVIVICVVGLWITGNSYFLLVGIIIGILDVLPFIGTGTILIPWAVLCVFQGDFYHAAAYVTIFVIANTTREYLEPRMLGDKLGVYPIVIAMVVYVGIRIYGVSGILLGPLTLLTIIECVREIYGSS